MPKGQSTKKELSFVSPKVSGLQKVMKTAGISAEERKALKEFMKTKTKVEKVSVPVRMKLDENVVKQLNQYVQMAIDEKKVSKNEGQAKGEIVSFALVKFLKGDRYFQEKVKK